MHLSKPLILAHVILFAISLSASAVEPIPLRAGPVTMVFEPENVFLRYIRLGPHEVLRGINAPVRDQNWSTVAPQVSQLQVENHGDRFRVTFDVLCQQGDIDFRWKGTIAGSPQGAIEFTFDGTAHSTFKRNRIGFCVLHGPGAAGQPWHTETSDGGSQPGRFPQLISPHQPAKNLRAIAHEVAPGIRARVEFEGDVFEMEDQRNWTDASFKTYCTPLELPYPVEIAAGTKIKQRVRIGISGNLQHGAPEASGATLSITDSISPLPRLGLQTSSETDQLTPAQLDRLRVLDLDHLRIDLDLSDESFVRTLRRATAQAKELQVSLQIGLHLGAAPAFNTLLAEIRNEPPPVTHWLVAGGDPAHFQETHKQLAPVAGDAKIGVTRITNFVDLNRARPTNNSIEVVGFAINPQIHAFDNASMIETLPIHADVVNSTRRFVGELPLVIGPITLRPQLVNGEDAPGGPPPGPLPSDVDPRQPDRFVAAWTLGSLKYLAEAGAHSATFYETVGWNGIMDLDNVTNRPAAFPSRPGEVFPVYRLFREFAEFAGGKVQTVDSSDALRAVGVALHKSGKVRVLLGNLTADPQTVTLRGFGSPITVRPLDGRESPVSPEIRVSLPPYGIARIDQPEVH